MQLFSFIDQRLLFDVGKSQYREPHGAGRVQLDSGEQCELDYSHFERERNRSDAVTFEVRENFTASARSGTLTIAGLADTVVQDGGLEIGRASCRERV